MIFGDEDEDNDFTPSPSTGSKLSALFGGTGSNKSSNLKYVAPKQPRSDSTGSGGEKTNPTTATQQQQPRGQPEAPAVLIAAAVHAYLYVNDVAQSQGRAMCCLLGNVAEKKFQLLLYRTQQDHLTFAKIYQNFTFTVQPNHYAIFSDNQQRSWSILIDTGQYADFVMQVGICRALSTLSSGSEQHITQDVIVGEGPALKEGDHAQISYTTWSIKNGKRGEQIEEAKTSQRIKLKEGSGSWDLRLLGTHKNGRRLIFLPRGKDNSVICHDVSVERVKQKGSGDHSGRSTPQVDLQHHLNDISSSNRSLNILPEDTESSVDNEGAPVSKSTIVSRMARMGHALLPTGVVGSRHPPTDSESEVEEISRRRGKPQKYRSGSVSGSVEELEATPAVRSRNSSVRSDSVKPELAPRPSSLPHHQPQQLVVYQSPWQQQPAVLPPGYAAVQSGPQTLSSVPQLPAAPASDPTISLLFSETRTQNTELKISVSKMSDKIDDLSSKIVKMEEQLKQREGAVGHSALVPANGAAPPHFSYLHPPNSSTVDAQAILTQITSLVSDNDDMKARLEEKEKKITALNESVTQLLQKNQKLLEEKTDMLIAKQDSGSTVSITEVLALREEKAEINAQLGIVQSQLTSLKEELLASKKWAEKQNEEMKNLEKQAQEEHAKRVEMENTSESQTKREEELYQSLKDAESEKERLKTLIEANKTREKESLDHFSDLADKKKELEEQLQASKSERDSLKEKLKTTLQQMEERTRGDGESSVEKDIEDQLRQDVESKTSRINQLEKELSDAQERCTEMEEQSQQSLKYQAQIQHLEAEKEALENLCNRMKNSSSNPEEVVGTVKKVMNTVFRTLKSQFVDDKPYTGAAVMQTLLSVIRDTTLQLLEEVDGKKTVEGNPPPEGETTAKSHEEDKGGNGALDICVSQTNRNDVSLKSVSGTKEVGSLAVPCHVENSCERVVCNEDMSVDKEVKERSKAGEEISGLLIGKDCDKEVQIADFENRIEVSSSEGEYTDASDRQYSPKSSTSRSSSNDSNSYDCDQSINNVTSLDSGNGKDLPVGSNIKTISDEEDKSSSSPHILCKDQRNPVIDMERTGAATVPAEKSDSSRDSSLDRAWRPQPPPPPLFSDEDDDDDWLS